MRLHAQTRTPAAAQNGPPLTRRARARPPEFSRRAKARRSATVLCYPTGADSGADRGTGTIPVFLSVPNYQSSGTREENLQYHSLRMRRAARRGAAEIRCVLMVRHIVRQNASSGKRIFVAHPAVQVPGTGTCTCSYHAGRKASSAASRRNRAARVGEPQNPKRI